MSFETTLRKLFAAAVLCLLLPTTAAVAQRHIRLKRADLLFHVAAQGNAITDVTPGMIDHVAIYMGGDSVVEAIGRGVAVTPLDSLRLRETGHYLVGRVRKVARRRSVRNALRYLGRPYDHLYLPDNEAIYCSELVQFTFVDRRNRPLFAPIPMSFHDATGRITAHWTQFYRQHGMEVPEGKPGTNPAELAHRHSVRIKGKL